MKRQLLALFVFGICAVHGAAQHPGQPYGREWLPGERGELTRTSFRNGPSWGSAAATGHCGTCADSDHSCMRRLFEFATYRPQFGDNRKLPTPYTPPLSAWFPNGSPQCSGDCGTTATCRDRNRIGVGGGCYGQACAAHTTIAERPHLPTMRSAPNVRAMPHSIRPNYYADEPPQRQPHTAAKPAAHLVPPTGYRMQPGADLLPMPR